MGPPAKELLDPFVFFYKDGNYIEMIRKIQNAWKKVTRKGRELGVRSYAARATYRQWVKDRVQEVKLPFKIPNIALNEESSTSNLMEDEEVRALKAKVAELTEKNKKIEDDLLKTRQTCVALEKEKSEKECAIEEIYKKRKIERDHAAKVSQCLETASSQLSKKGKERDIILAEKQHLKERLERAKKGEKDALSRVENMQQTIEDLGRQIKDMAIVHESEVNNEMWQCIKMKPPKNR